MSGMNDIETPVCENDPLAILSEGFDQLMYIAELN
jgi:hypothetical protein